MTTEIRIMIVDDDVATVKKISAYLRELSYQTKVFLEGESALREFPSWRPSLVLLDLGLPGMDGFAICRKIRESSDVPIIILSSNQNIPDKIRVLDLGADDYITKPCDLGEVGARIRAALRRYTNAFSAVQAEASQGDYVSYPGLLINQTNYSVLYDGKNISMPPKELELLYCLAASPNRVFTREQLLDRVWGYEYEGDARTVDVHMKRIRQKIKDHETWSLATVWGVGYKFEVKSLTGS